MSDKEEKSLEKISKTLTAGSAVAMSGLGGLAFTDYLLHVHSLKNAIYRSAEIITPEVVQKALETERMIGISGPALGTTYIFVAGALAYLCLNNKR